VDSFLAEKMGPEKIRPRFYETSLANIARSENKLQAQLHSTAATGTDYGVSCGNVRSSARASEWLNGRIVEAEAILSAVRVREIRVIENVEELSAELGM
jgi:hypothetical protein